MADSLSLHGDIRDGELDMIVHHWSKLDARLRSFDAGTVSMQLFVKERDTKSQHVTLDVKIDGKNPLVATSASADFSHALNEVRDEMIRQITDMKTSVSPATTSTARDRPPLARLAAQVLFGGYRMSTRGQCSREVGHLAR